MNDSSIITPGLAQLALVRALLDRVTPDLRGVVVSWGEAHIWARFYYAREVDDEVAELLAEAESEVIADLPPNASVHFTPTYLSVNVDRDTEFDVRRGDVWVYRRRE